MSIKLKGSSDGSVSLDAPADTSPTGTDVFLTLPTSAGSANQLLITDGSGTLDWTSDVTRLDLAQTFTKGQRGEITQLTDAANIAMDLDDSNHFVVTLAGNRTLDNPSNMTIGQSGMIVIKQDGTGSRTLAYGSYWKFAFGTAPTLTTTANRTDILSYFVISTTEIVGALMSDVR